MSAITMTNAGLNLLRDGTSGANNAKITYVALGTSSTAPAVTDTLLGAETFRKAVSTYTNGTTGEILVSMYLGPNDDIGGNIQEVGFFGGNTASASPNTGVLLAHGLYAHNPKTGIESITFTLDLTI